jgi:transposase
MTQRIIGIDLGVTARHEAAILDLASNQFLVKHMRFQSLPEELDKLLERACKKASEPCELIAILEATSMAWYPISLYLDRQGVKVYRVNGRQTQALRGVYAPHARSDRIDGQVLARLWQTAAEHLMPLWLPTAQQMHLQRLCREFVRWRDAAVAVQNRLTAYDQWAWTNLAAVVPSAAIPWVRRHWYDPWRVVQAGPSQLATAWLQSASPQQADVAWISEWIARAQQMIVLFGSSEAVDFPTFEQTIRRNLDQLASCEQTMQQLSAQIEPLYCQLYPNSPLETIYGIGRESAAIYMAFIGSIARFPSVACFRQWCGIVPASSQSGQAQSKGLHLTQAGIDPVKATLYLNANVARQWDLQLAKIYYTQMVDFGKHHHQAVCAVASHLASRIYAVLKQDRRFELRDLDGQPISSLVSRQQILAHYQVPDEVRQRTNVRTRRRPELTGLA